MKKTPQLDRAFAAERVLPQMPEDLPADPVERTVALLRSMANQDTALAPIERATIDSAIDAGLMIVGSILGLGKTLERIADALEGGKPAPAIEEGAGEAAGE